MSSGAVGTNGAGKVVAGAGRERVVGGLRDVGYWGIGGVLVGDW